MARAWMILCFALLFNCKSTSQQETSEVKAWEMDGNREAAYDFIVATVTRHFPATKAEDPAVQLFAKALQDRRTQQTESADYVLQVFWQESREGSVGAESPIVLYIAQEFLAQTNYLAYTEKLVTQLEFMGTK
jgi:hypothetical protein